MHSPHRRQVRNQSPRRYQAKPVWECAEKPGLARSNKPLTSSFTSELSQNRGFFIGLLVLVRTADPRVLQSLRCSCRFSMDSP